jgi:hypothetical protein
VASPALRHAQNSRPPSAAVVFQDVGVLDASIEDNIRMNNPNATEERARASAPRPRSTPSSPALPAVAPSPGRRLTPAPQTPPLNPSICGTLAPGKGR